MRKGRPGMGSRSIGIIVILLIATVIGASVVMFGDTMLDRIGDTLGTVLAQAGLSLGG